MLITCLEVIRDDGVQGFGGVIMVWSWSISLPSPAFDGCSDSPLYPFGAHWKAMVSVAMPILPTNKSPELKTGEFGVTASVSLRKIITSPAGFACTLNLSWLQQYLHLLNPELSPRKWRAWVHVFFHSSYTPAEVLPWCRRGIQGEKFHRKPFFSGFVSLHWVCALCQVVTG